MLLISTGCGAEDDIDLHSDADLYRCDESAPWSAPPSVEKRSAPDTGRPDYIEVDFGAGDSAASLPRCRVAVPLGNRRIRTAHGVILDAECRVIREIDTTFAHDVDTSSVRVISWDTRDQSGRLMPNGLYYINVRIEGDQATSLARFRVDMIKARTCEVPSPRGNLSWRLGPDGVWVEVRE